MSALADKLNALIVGGERSVLFGYIWRTKRSKKFYSCQDNYLVVPDVEGSKLILCQKRNIDDFYFFICFQCAKSTVFENLGNIKNVDEITKDYCMHAKLCTILLSEGTEPRKKVVYKSTIIPRLEGLSIIVELYI